MTSKKAKKGKREGRGDVSLVTDERFSAMHSVPIFKPVAKDEHKVALDSRFSGVLTDERFRVPTSKYDKYGRKQAAGGAKDELSKFYTLDDGDDCDDDNELADAEAEMEAAKDASFTGELKHTSPRCPPVVWASLRRGAF